MKKITKIALALAFTLTITGCGANSNESSDKGEEVKSESTDAFADKDVIKLGVIGEKNAVWEDVAKRYEEGTGKKIEIVAFSEYREPNEALISKDIDINAFQHKKFLEDFNEANGSDIVSIADTVIAPLGIYSNKIKDINELKDGARVAIPDDPTNCARSLFLLQSAGLLKVDGKEGEAITVDNITENPKNLEIVELAASQTARSLDDVDIATVNSGYAVDGGYDPVEDAIYLEDPDDPEKAIYVNIVAALPENKDSETLKDLIDNYYHTDQTKEIIKKDSNGADIPSF